MSAVELDIGAAFSRGTVSFYGLELLVSPGALVPRPETELLARAAIEVVQGAGATPLVIDVCCGAGNLACAIARHTPARVFACDLTRECAELAERNRAWLGLGERVRVFQGDLFAPLAAEVAAGSVDVIVCNPPYISTGRLSQDRAVLLDLEPREAFDGGPYGLSIHQRVIREAASLLAPGGTLLFEFGLGQERQLSALFARAQAFRDVRFWKDGANAPRVVGATRA